MFKKLKPAVNQSQLGDPVTGSTSYAVCIYDENDVLVSEMEIGRAQSDCGTPPRPCWRALSDKGYKYDDKGASADGIHKIIAKGGGAGKGRIIVKGKNNAPRGQLSLPTGIAPLLQDNAKATVQIVTSDADCFGMTTTDVKKADASLFKAFGGSPSAAFLDVTSDLLD